MAHAARMFWFFIALAAVAFTATPSSAQLWKSSPGWAQGKSFCKSDIDCDDEDPCTLNVCDRQTGLCSNPPLDCDDTLTCTEDFCIEGSCFHSNNCPEDTPVCTSSGCVACELDCDGKSNDPSCFDCNENGIPDGCDIGFCDPSIDSECDDCNYNGVPDGCENITPDDCAFFSAGCGTADQTWDCDGNWTTMAPYPNVLEFGGPFNVVIDSSFGSQPVVFLDEPLNADLIQINTLVIRDGATLRFTPFRPSPVGRLIVTDPEGIAVRSDLLMGGGPSNVEQGEFTIEVLGGPGLGADGSAGVTIEQGGSYRAADAFADTAEDSLAAPCVQIDGCEFQRDAGQMALSGEMVVQASDSFLLNGDGGGKDPGCDPCLETSDAATIQTCSFEIVGSANISYNSSEPLSLECEFSNGSTDPSTFQWEDGAIEFVENSAPGPSIVVEQFYEVAGRDVGPDCDGLEQNFAVGELRLTDQTHVTAHDLLDNDLQGQSPCSEAQYVRTLTLGANATLTLQDCRIYYEELILDPSASIVVDPPDGCGGAQPIQCADPCADDDGDGRITICHTPPGNPGNAHTLTVSVNALPAHLNHGDYCGPCAGRDGLHQGRRR